MNVYFMYMNSIWQMWLISFDNFISLQGLSPNVPVTLDQRDEVKMLEITIKKEQTNKTVEIELSVELCIKLSKYICWRRCSHQLSGIMKNIEYTVDVVDINRKWC